MIYFEPTEEFLRWLIERAQGRMIVDLGCGEGWLIHRLRQLGYQEVSGVEIKWPNLSEMPQSFWSAEYTFNLPQNAVFQDDAQHSKLITSGNCLLVIARPDHSGWVETVIKRAKSEVLYISKPSNAKIDLGFEGCAYSELDAPECGEDKAYLVRYGECT